MKTHKLGRSTSTKASTGLRTVAVFEAVKGSLVLLLAGGVLDLVHDNVDNLAERLSEVLHVSPDGKLSKLFVKLPSHATEGTLWLLALGTLVYAAVRWIEAYGLWRELRWAQWFALLSTAFYLPPELYWLLRRPSWLRCGVLASNALILLFMVSLRVKATRRRSPCVGFEV